MPESRLREVFFTAAVRRELARVAVKKVGPIESRPRVRSSEIERLAKLIPPGGRKNGRR